MNIHEHQAKEILKEFGASVPEGVVIYDIKEIKEKIDQGCSQIFLSRIFETKYKQISGQNSSSQQQLNLLNQIPW